MVDMETEEVLDIVVVQPKEPAKAEQEAKKKIRKNINGKMIKSKP